MFKVLTEEEQLFKKVNEIDLLIRKLGSMSNFMHDKKEKSISRVTKIRYETYIDDLFNVKNELSDYYDLLAQKRLDILNSEK